MVILAHLVRPLMGVTPTTHPLPPRIFQTNSDPTHAFGERKLCRIIERVNFHPVRNTKSLRQTLALAYFFLHFICLFIYLFIYFFSSIICSFIHVFLFIS